MRPLGTRFSGRALVVTALAGLAVLAAACSSGENSFRRIGALARATLSGPKQQEPARELTRAELNQIPYATIALRFQDGPPTYLVPLADNGGYLTYLDQNRRGLVMKGGAVTATKALGEDLRAVRHHRDDPIATPTPLADWPGRLHRDYQFRVRDTADYSVTLDCVFERLAAETIEIAELNFEVVRVSEVCTNAARQVVNTYWVEADTGFIWKSQQWLGPNLAPATIEIIRPYGA
jgi:hypothetical protein